MLSMILLALAVYDVYDTIKDARKKLSVFTILLCIMAIGFAGWDIYELLHVEKYI